MLRVAYSYVKFDREAHLDFGKEEGGLEKTCRM